MLQLTLYWAVAETDGGTRFKLAYGNGCCFWGNGNFSDHKRAYGSRKLGRRRSTRQKALLRLVHQTFFFVFVFGQNAHQLLSVNAGKPTIGVCFVVCRWAWKACERKSSQTFKRYGIRHNCREKQSRGEAKGQAKGQAKRGKLGEDWLGEDWLGEDGLVWGLA